MASNLSAKRGSDRGDYGFARVRDLAYDAVISLWRRRKAEGLKQTDIATVLNRDPAWVSRQLAGPGNWTLRTFGELVEAMNGEAEIQVFGLEDPEEKLSNFDAYAGYGAIPTGKAALTTSQWTKAPIQEFLELDVQVAVPNFANQTTIARQRSVKRLEHAE